MTEPSVSHTPAQAPGQLPGQRVGIVGQILGHDEDDDDRPLPELPPLPADPRWRIEHLPFVSAIGFAAVLCAASLGFLIGHTAAAALGAGGGVLVVTVGITLTTLTIAWADVIRPELVMPVGLGVFMVKYAAIIWLLFAVDTSGWSGAQPLFWGVGVGAVVLTGVQAWWLARLARLRSPA